MQTASDLDAFMARVLEHRSETWRALHDYILSERERFELTGPAEQRLYGTRREFTWFVRDGYLIRSPTSLDGVTPDSAHAAGLRAALAARGAGARETRVRESTIEVAKTGSRRARTGGRGLRGAGVA